MSRTFRKQKKSYNIVRDGEGSGSIMPFEKAPSLKDELEFMELENDLSRTRDNQIYLRERQILSYTWDIPISKIDLIYCSPINELCIYVDNEWRGYLDENPPLTDMRLCRDKSQSDFHPHSGHDGHSWFVITNGKYWNRGTFNLRRFDGL